MYIYIDICTGQTGVANARGHASELYAAMPSWYTQFAIQDSGLFRPNPRNFLAQIVYVFP